MLFVSLQTLFSFSRKSNFRIFYIYVSWCFIRNTFFWLIWEANSLLTKLGQFMSNTKEKNLSRNFTKNATWKLVPGLLSLQRIKHNLYWKMNLLKQATYIRYVLVKLLKFVKISTDLLRFLFPELSLRIKMGLELVSKPYFS